MIPWLLIGFSLLAGPVTGLDNDDFCDRTNVQYSTNYQERFDYNRCDTRKGLYCTEFSRCACYVVDSYYDYYYKRCIAKVGYPCKASHSFTIPCGDNAECPSGTGFCQCRPGYFPTYDRRACTNDGTKPSVKMSLVLGILSVGRFLMK